MTLPQIEQQLRAAGIEEARCEARLLASHFTGLSPSRLMAMRGEELPASPALADAVRRRTAREPLQYILGEWEFMGLPFTVSPDCLIPRADTETLVEAAIRLLPQGAKVADLCTGSGCIGISLAHYRPDCAVTAVDISAPALQIAQKNAARLGVTERFRAVLGDVTAADFLPEARFDAVLANPPYITAEEMLSLEPELSLEPRIALTDGGDGLSVIRGIFRFAQRALPARGLLLCEIGSGQGESVTALARAAGFETEILRDLAGKDRVIKGIKEERL